MRNFVITVNGTSYEVAVEEVEAGAALKLVRSTSYILYIKLI